MCSEAWGRLRDEGADPKGRKLFLVLLACLLSSYFLSLASSHLFGLPLSSLSLYHSSLSNQIPVATNKWKHVGCIAGGTGITPMYQ